jgi:hypothetical protein
MCAGVPNRGAEPLIPVPPLSRGEFRGEAHLEAQEEAPVSAALPEASRCSPSAPGLVFGLGWVA